jgi:SAM-dependent methyltransferase
VAVEASVTPVRGTACDAREDHRLRYYPEARFGGFTRVDPLIAFYTRVNALVQPESTVLDVGCGRGAYGDDPVPARRNARVLKGRCRVVLGIDIDAESGARNPYVDEFRAIEGPRWPVDDASVDVALCDQVLEHVEEPARLFAELARVVRPGGYVCIRTPNALSYFGAVSRLIPNRFHAAVARRVQIGRSPEDVFPTRYRCNTRRRLWRMLADAGFAAYVYLHEGEPAYLSFSRAAYWLGTLHQRFAPEMVRLQIFAFGRRGRTDLVEERRP